MTGTSPQVARERAQRASSRLVSKLLEPTDAAWLAALRVLFGLLVAVSMSRFIAYGWVDRFFVQPRFHFKYWGFGWVEPLPAASMHGLFWALVGLALLMAAGLLYRVAAPLLAAGLTYVQLIDVTTYLNHYYLAALIAWLLAFCPAQRVWSIDAWLMGARGPRTVASGVLYLFRFQVGVVYVCAGLAKLQSDWLLHAQPLRIWLGSSVDLPVIGEWLRWPWVPLALSWAGFLFDSTIVLWLSLRRVRAYAYAVLLVFHALTRVLFPIGMFPLIMSCAALVFFSPSWPRRALRMPLTNAAESGARPRRVWVWLGLGYCLVQLILPLRFAAYGGNVLWHEQGMRFSWRVMVRAKGGDVMFVVRERAGRVFHVSPRAYLTDLQESEMSSQPDLILQLAQHIGHDLEQRGHGQVAVHADARVALNGRRSRPMIDPSVDLTQVRDGLAPAHWILPAPENSPPHTRVVR
ncbi:MAG TPA: HTTM domain-containing protein [Polyangiales bacterium]|nr:HTTM domain-containing protein [Polyangiales bacterium]